jgi:alpha-1,2-mannosyltransferase
LVLVGLNLVSVWHQLVLSRHDSYTLDRYRIDLDVYRIGSAVWRNAGDLYAPMRPTRAGVSLPFTYPPIAAVLLSPLSVVPYAVATVGITVVSIAMLAVVVVVFLRASGVPRQWLVWGLGAVMPLALFIEPVQANLSFGQVNVALMMLVALDCLLPRTRWPRGLLVGLAAATKLTPAVFVIFFLVRRDRRSARNAALSFLVATCAGFLLSWHSSMTYWTSTVFETSRIGGVGYVGNQSAKSVVARVGLSGAPATLVWIVVSVAVLVVAVRGMSRAFDAGQIPAALVLNALAALLISPVSWSHHWVWIVPTLICLVALAWRARIWMPAALAAVGLVLFSIGPQWKLPQGGDRELAWSWGQQLVGSCYVWFGAAVLFYAATSRTLWRVSPGRIDPDRLDPTPVDPALVEVPEPLPSSG